MINFKTKLPKWEIHDENGNLVNARELPDKSITTEAMADEFLSTPHQVVSYMKALDNKSLLNFFMKYMGSLADHCIEKSKSDRLWDSTYNTAIVYLLDNLIDRYTELFKTYGVTSAYDGHSEIKSLYEKSIDRAHVSVNGRELLDVQYIRHFHKDVDIRANTAGFKALIPHYNKEQFIETLQRYLENCRASSEQTNFWFVALELIRRIESGKI